MEYKVKIDINEFFERYTKIYEEIQYCIGHTEDGIMEMDEFYQRMKELNFGYPWAEVQVMVAHLTDIAKRAIELNDKQLLESCEALEIVKEEKC